MKKIYNQNKIVYNKSNPIFPDLEIHRMFHMSGDSKHLRSKKDLIDYKVRVLNPEEASAAKVRVFITTTDNKRTWDTVGVSENIIEASWEAIVDSLDYFYNNL